MYQVRREDLGKNELREGQFGEWLKGVNGRRGSKASEGWGVGRMKGVVIE